MTRKDLCSPSKATLEYTPAWMPPTPSDSDDDLEESCRLDALGDRVTQLGCEISTIVGFLRAHFHDSFRNAHAHEQTINFDERIASLATLEHLQAAWIQAQDRTAAAVASLECTVALDCLRERSTALEKQVSDLRSKLDCQAARSRACLPGSLDLRRKDPSALFVGGLANQITAADLVQLFSDSEQSPRARVLTDAVTGESKRCGFVYFNTTAACQSHLSRYMEGGLECAGRPIRIEPKRRPPSRRQ
eukprot:TRINITY_DN20282_c0_g1_i4.p1 TRINITY_DN20282_c0_g1~~TRINITY_DN20282_c0_g1_i4.p1  ORF type:complete len:247 (+),score=21.02 TRINITY_DN20282_c0_g1_i4:282-1022(+)